MKTLLLSCMSLFWLVSVARAQQSSSSSDKGPLLGESKTQSWRIGAKLSANGAVGKNVVAAMPFPKEWPEQTVKVVKEDVPSGAKVSYKPATSGATQLLITVASLSGEKQATVTIEVTRSALTPPTETGHFVVPEAARLKADMRVFLTPSHHIESDNPKFQTLAKEITADKVLAWQRVEAIYDWTREHVKDRNSADKGALADVQNGSGDGVEISSVFVALCRAAGVPARLVWLPRHCHPEFYLEDQQGQGHWFPCRAAGKREFGGLTEHRPILSKGDKFPSPDRPRETERFVAENVTGFAGKPTAQFIRELAK